MTSKQTTLDLNGPIISFLQQPQSISLCNGGTATFVGIATAFFPQQIPPNPALNTGSLSYRWYAENFGPLTDGSFKGATISGSGTNTLIVSNAKSPETNNIRFYLSVDYIPSAYSQPSGSTVTNITQRTTGNAINEIYNSNTATLTVFPTLSIIQQPQDQTVAQNNIATFTTLGSLTDITQGEISYRWQLNGTDLTDSSTVSGSGTTNLSISSPNVGTSSIRARLTHPTACNSPLFTDYKTFNVVDPRQIVNFERFDETNLYSTGSQNIADSSITLTGDSSITFLQYCIYASEEDVKVKITLAGGAGVSRSGFRGGQGGVSVLVYTLKQNVEYILKLGSGTPPTGGSNGGGGGAFLYEKARIIAVCGGGGGAGTSGRGGDGGGVNVSGESGQGSGAGAGGRSISAGTLPSNTGYDNSGTTGGQVSGCTIGNYYANYYTPCADVGQVKFRTGNGTILSGTATLLRGWKSGAGYRNNGGDGSGNQGGGGAGTYGGNAATSNGAGGGGGSGYTDGSITLISTQLGGNSSTNAYAIIEKVN